MAEIANGIKHTPETEEYGISSFVYRASMPFHPKRLYDWMTQYFLLQELCAPTEEEGEAETAAAPPPQAAVPSASTSAEEATSSSADRKRQREAEEKERDA